MSMTALRSLRPALLRQERAWPAAAQLQQRRALSSWWWDSKKGDKAKKSGDENSQNKGEAQAESKVEAGEAVGQAGGTGDKAKPSHGSIAPVLELQGAPRHPNVIALPLDRKPLFPGMLHPVQLTDRRVYLSLMRARASGQPYVGLFLRKQDLAAANPLEVTPSDLIHDLSEVHSVGTFAQIVQMEPVQGLLSAGDDDSDFEDADLVIETNGGDGGSSGGRRLTHEPREGRDRMSEVGGGSDPKKLLSSAKEETYTLVVKAHRRIQIESLEKPGPPPTVRVKHISEFPLNNYDTDKVRAYTNEVVNALRDVIRHNPLLREHMDFFSARFDMSDPHHVCNFAASLTSADAADLQEVLEAFNLETRLKKVLTLLKKEVEVNVLQQEISKQVEATISANQRKYFLNEQLKQIKKELGLEHDDKDALLSKYKERLDLLKSPLRAEEAARAEAEAEALAKADAAAVEAGHEPGADPRPESERPAAQEERKRRYQYSALPADACRVIEDEMKKLSTLEKTSPEFNVTRAYLDWLLSLPWGKCTEENLDVKNAKEILEADHFGLSDIKERILEFIAVGNLRGTVQGKIILLVGPPGVGKTSIGMSIAHALDREFYRFSVGGLTDVSEIKGHRRTYIGAMPGKVIQCLKTTGVSNPVVLVDEIDKLGSGYRGDPASALLELLDPAQNNTFVDHYVDVPVDLSKVLFVCTANSTDTIPGPLLDRMEVLRLSGYDLPEKVQIAKRYLEPRAKKDCGLVVPEEGQQSARKPPIEVPSSLGIDDGAIEALARWYCREAGVRKLEQHIERVYRKISLELLESDPDKIAATNWNITEDRLEKYVGKPRYQSDKLFDSVPPPGVVMGLAWSTTGGSALYIETTRIRRPAATDAAAGADAAGGDNSKAQGASGGGVGFSVHTTGQLGDVMKESTSLALTYSRHKLQELDPGNPFFERNQIHMHVPEGATPKDGPSAGVTMTTALLGLATGKSVRADLAMTGEISLTGMVLPVGGIKEKVIAARRSGVTTIVLPDGNRKDVDELPDYLKKELDIHFAKRYDDVYDVAFAT